MAHPPSILKSRKKHGPPRIRLKPLTPQERLFAKELVLHDDGMRALSAAYPEYDKLSPGERAGHVRAIKSRERVQREMDHLRAVASQDAGFEVSDALAEYLAIWQADPNELCSVRIGCCRYCHGADHAYQWREREYLEALHLAEREQAAVRGKRGFETEEAVQKAHPLPGCGGGFDFDPAREPHEDCPECRGEGVPRIVPKDTMLLSEQGRKLFAGVKLTKFGPEIQFHDRMKALETAAKIIGAFEDRVRIQATVQQSSASINFETNDPNQAAEAYKLLMAAGS